MQRRASQVLLSRSWGLSVIDAVRIAERLGIRAVRFASMGRRSPRTPGVRRSPIVDTRGARFLAQEQRELAH